MQVSKKNDCYHMDYTGIDVKKEIRLEKLYC